MSDAADAADLATPFDVTVPPDEPRREHLVDLLSRAGPDMPEVTRWRRERHTTHLWVDAGPDIGKLFIKIYRSPLRRNLNTILLQSRAEREYRNSRLAEERGLPVLPAVAFGEIRRRGIMRACVIAFDDVGRCQSLMELVRQGKKGEQREQIRTRALLTTAGLLGQLHDAGYLHLAASPRNLLLVGNPEEKYVWIDHTAALAFNQSIRAQRSSLPDVLQALASRLVRSDEGRDLFLERYAPGNVPYRRTVLRLWNMGVRSKLLRRWTRVRRAFGL